MTLKTKPVFSVNTEAPQLSMVSYTWTNLPVRHLLVHLYLKGREVAATHLTPQYL